MLLRPETASLQSPARRENFVLCECHKLNPPASGADQLNTLGPLAATGDAWSRLGPMGPLLDPKMYPARVGQSPESETMRFNQPNVFLKKVT